MVTKIVAITTVAWMRLRLSRGEIWSATSWHSKRKPSNRSTVTRQMDSKIMVMGSRSKKGKKKRMRRRTFTS